MMWWQWHHDDNSEGGGELSSKLSWAMRDLEDHLQRCHWCFSSKFRYPAVYEAHAECLSVRKKWALQLTGTASSSSPSGSTNSEGRVCCLAWPSGVVMCTILLVSMMFLRCIGPYFGKPSPAEKDFSWAVIGVTLWKAVENCFKIAFCCGWVSPVLWKNMFFFFLRLITTQCVDPKWSTSGSYAYTYDHLWIYIRIHMCIYICI